MVAEDLALTVADVLLVPPLDQGSVIAGRRGLNREIRWVDIMHTPAEAFVRPGFLVLTTGADVREPGVRDFLTYLVESPAAGLVLSPPPHVPLQTILTSLIPVADRNEFPVLFLPWECAFSEVTRNLLPRLSPAETEADVELAIGQRPEGREDGAAVGAFVRTVSETAQLECVSADVSLTEGVIMIQFRPPQTATRVLDILAFAGEDRSSFRDLGHWTFLGPGRESVQDGKVAAVPLAEGPGRPQVFLEVLRQHPRSISLVTRLLQPLLDYDTTRKGQLVHTLDVLLQEGLNSSAAARRLYLNRHSLLYRVQLIEDLTGCSLKDASARFNLEVSVRVHQHSGPPPAQPDWSAKRMDRG